ncbi:hypothetical protein [Nubsella zeaxanthinifaciens]|jgi:hypothetical protein|uniref:hypothetical protein n=1 Tax=Nubsella zeaxanthinifaciens TaxID=392412 RepID=UPI000DE4CAA0|nr:hypothetical protein [Nubsella zeaxanthinifaciens]
MKKIYFIVLAAVAFAVSCTKSNPELLNPTEKEKVLSKTSNVTYSTCTYDNVITPNSYTGFTDPSTQTDPGFGIFSDDLYDRGWKAGYEDALFYHNYYVYDGPNQCGSFEMYKVVKNTSTNEIKNEDIYYSLLENEVNTGIGIKLVSNETCNYDFLLKRCVLLNSGSSKSLRLQYQFNTTYPNRTSDQISFDNGRYDGFYRGVSQQPFSN